MQGNYTAFQQLKPTEYKNGQYYNDYIDKMIKEGRTQEAMRLKRLQEDRKDTLDRFKDIKVDPINTHTTLQEFANNYAKLAYDSITNDRFMAMKDPENKEVYIAKAKRTKLGVDLLDSLIGNKEWVKSINDKVQSVANGDYFDEDESLGLLNAFESHPGKIEVDKQGDIQLYIPYGKGGDETVIKPMSLAKFVEIISRPAEVNLLESNKSNGNYGFLDKEAREIAKNLAHKEEVDNDGNVTMTWKGYDEKRGQAWYDERFGGYNANDIPKIVSQYARKVLKRSFKDGDEEANKALWEDVKSGILGVIKNLTPTEFGKDVKHSALEIANQKASLIEKQLDIQKKQHERARGYKNDSGNGDSGGGVSYNFTIGNQDTYVKTTDGRLQRQPMRVVGLPPIKGHSDNTLSIGLTRYYDKNGKIQNAFYLGNFASDGKIVTSRISQKELSVHLNKMGLNPVIAMQSLFVPIEENGKQLLSPVIAKGLRPVTITDQNIINRYSNVEVFPKTQYENKDIKQRENIEGFKLQSAPKK